MTGSQSIVTGTLCVMIALLYSRRLSAPVIFIAAAAFLTAIGIISPHEALAGFGNDAIAVMLMLIALSEIIRRTGTLDLLLRRSARLSGNYRGFLGQMMTFTAGASAFMNNTPLVAMLVPVVGDWGRKHGVPASKLLMPLSWAAILGGMTTLVGTSTNLIVNSLVIGSGLGSLSMLDFTPVGLMIAVTGLVYIMLAGHRLLPSRRDPVSILEENDREYLVEASISPDSPLAGSTVEQAAQGSLRGLYVAELFREGRMIAPVGPDEVFRAGDRLVLAGNTSNVADLLKDCRGLTYSERFDPPRQGTLRIVETVVSTSSSLVNRKIRETDFRATWDAAILAVHRQGERLSGKIGEVRLQPGDLLLLVTGGDFEKAATRSDDLFVISMIGEIRKVNIPKSLFILASSFTCLALSAVGLVPLFTSLLVLITAFLALNLVTLPDLKDSLNFDLLTIAAFSLAIGTAVHKCGLAASLSGVVVDAFQPFGVVGVLAAVYLVTSILTEFITNAAAASIIFPFAAASAAAMGVEGTPFFLAVAFGASSSFITPIGYQTNLIIFGPGGYRFSDFLRAGLPLKVLCAVVAVTGLSLWYGLL